MPETRDEMLARMEKMRANKGRGRQADITIIDDLTPAAVVKENARLRDLLAWVAPRIRRVNGSGTGVSDKHCLMCTMGWPEYKRQPCRHDEIFAIAKEGA